MLNKELTPGDVFAGVIIISLAFLFVFLLFKASYTPEQSEQREIPFSESVWQQNWILAELADRLLYTRDETTGICFAVYMSGNRSGLAVVDCSLLENVNILTFQTPRN